MRLARLPSLRVSIPEAPAVSVRDPWPGDAARGARLLKGELTYYGAVRTLKPGYWADQHSAALLRAHAHGFTWLRDLREIGTDAARMRARALVSDWLEGGPSRWPRGPMWRAQGWRPGSGITIFSPPPRTTISASACCGGWWWIRVCWPPPCRPRKWTGGR
jgi:hypothetical protein